MEECCTSRNGVGVRGSHDALKGRPRRPFCLCYQRLSRLLGCFKWQLHIAQTAFGFYQDERSCVDLDQCWAFSGNMNLLRFSFDGCLHSCDLCGI